MKIAFSTLGCPKWEIEQIVEAARSSGYDGVELRFYAGSLDLPQVLGGFAGGAGAFRRRLQDDGVAVCCLDTSVVLSSPDMDPETAEQMMDLALELGTDYVRVFGGNPAEGESREDCLKRAGANLRQLGKVAAGRGLRVLLETHDAFSSGAQVAELLEVSGEEGVGVLWDLHHPVRMGESPTETARLIGSRTHHVHVKDGRKGGAHTLLGQGDIPLRELVGELHKLGYSGYLSLEWEKAWIPELAEPEVAFPHAAAYLKELLAELGVPRG